MSQVINNIDVYIAQFSDDIQKKLLGLHELVLSVAPKETTTDIVYKMPTYRYHGNIFHFAVNKHHIGLYPGPKAIEHFKDQMTMYKSSKGAIQIPLDEKLPKSLIKSLVLFNVEAHKNKIGPNWHQERGNWEEAYELMSNLINQTTLKQEHKWGTSVYTHKGKNVVAWGGFKNFFSIWFYNGVFLSDPYKVLVSASEGKTKSLRQWRLTSIKDFDRKKILAYIEESIQTIEAGKVLPKESSSNIEPCTVFADYLKKNKALDKAFHQLTKGRQKEYILYIQEAKQEPTKHKRMEKISALIIEGKGLHDQYKK